MTLSSQLLDHRLSFRGVYDDDFTGSGSTGTSGGWEIHQPSSASVRPSSVMRSSGSWEPAALAGQ